jgi:hypothetical protein
MVVGPGKAEVITSALQDLNQSALDTLSSRWYNDLMPTSRENDEIRSEKT